MENTASTAALEGETVPPSDEPDTIASSQQVASLSGSVRRADVQAILSFLGDRSALVRWEASLALAESASNLQRPSGLEQVLTMTGVDSITVGDLLAAMESRIGSTDPAERAAVAEALGRWPHQAAVDLLERALTDSEAMVRATAARGLGQLGALESSESLIAALTDTSLWVRRAAADALGAIADPRTVEPLVKLARQGPILTRTAALGALGHLPGKLSRETVAACLDDADGEVRWQAVRALEAIGTSSSLPALERLTGDRFVLFDESVGDVALEAIKAIGQREQGVWHALRLTIIRIVSRFRRRPA